MEMISKHLSFDRATYSYNAVTRGVRNIPGEREVAALTIMGHEVYDKVVEKFGRVFPSSVYRNTRVNQLAGGSSTSGHVKGECIDLDGDAPSGYWASVDNNILFNWIRQNLKYDQLIAEYEVNGRPKWVHVGFRAVGNRQQTLIATKNSAGKTVYMWYSDSLYKKIYRNSRDIGFVVEDVFEMPATDWQTQQDEETGEEDFGYEVLGNRDYNPEPLMELEEPITTVAPLQGDVLVADGNPLTVGETVTIEIAGVEVIITVRPK